MGETVKRYDFFAYIDDDVAELDGTESDEGAYVCAHDYDTLATRLAESEAVINQRNGELARLHARVAELEALKAKAAVPDGWKLVAVNAAPVAAQNKAPD